MGSELEVFYSSTYVIVAELINGRMRQYWGSLRYDNGIISCDVPQFHRPEITYLGIAVPPVVMDEITNLQ
jgi:hypothetical protein